MFVCTANIIFAVYYSGAEIRTTYKC